MAREDLTRIFKRTWESWVKARRAQREPSGGMVLGAAAQVYNRRSGAQRLSPTLHETPSRTGPACGVVDKRKPKVPKRILLCRVRPSGRCGRCRCPQHQSAQHQSAQHQGPQHRRAPGAEFLRSQGSLSSPLAMVRERCCLLEAGAKASPSGDGRVTPDVSFQRLPWPLTALLHRWIFRACCCRQTCPCQSCPLTNHRIYQSARRCRFARLCRRARRS
jgi:hypothetical protein